MIPAVDRYTMSELGLDPASTDNSNKVPAVVDFAMSEPFPLLTEEGVKVTSWNSNWTRPSYVVCTFHAWEHLLLSLFRLHSTVSVQLPAFDMLTLERGRVLMAVRRCATLFSQRTSSQAAHSK